MLDNVQKRQIRSAILAEVYQENRRVFHNESPPPLKQSWQGLSGKTAICIIALMYLLLGRTGTLDSSLYVKHENFQTASITGDIAPTPDASKAPRAQEAPPPQKKREPAPADTAEYRPTRSLQTLKATDYRYLRNIQQASASRVAGRTPRPGIIDSSTISLRQVFGLNVKTIVIDAGHGGRDPGTIGDMGLQEKDVALDMAKRLKQRLERYGVYKVMLTRDKDVTLSLKDRIEFANSTGADLFISLHVNYVPAMPENMIETYYFGPAQNESDLELALLENAESMVGINEFQEMGEHLDGAVKFQESRLLASRIQESLFTNISKNSENVLDRGIKRAPFLVIMGTEMPGVLAEVTCMSNAAEEKKLRESTYREDLAAYLETGIRNYLTKGDYIYEARRE